MAASLPSDASDLESESSSQIAESGYQSDISVSSVNTEDLTDLDFSEDDEEDGEIGWSRDRASVNVTPFTARAGAVSGVAEDGTAKDFFQLFIADELCDMIVEETNRYARQCIARKPDQSGKTQAVKKCKHSLASMCCSGITTFPRHLCTGPKTKPLGLPS